jgi:hypothetical protein
MARERLDMERIAAALGAKRRGQVDAGGGWFGAVQLAAEVAARFRAPAGGGRATNPEWTEHRIVRFSRRTLERLAAMAKRISEEGGRSVEPLQLAALLLEMVADESAQARRARRSTSRPRSNEARAVARR